MAYHFADFQAGVIPPKGWDVAEAVEDGWTGEEAEQFLRITAKPYSPVVEEKPEEMRALDFDPPSDPDIHLDPRYNMFSGDPTEDVLALTFERANSGRLRYCHTTGTWFLWDGSRWKRDTTRRAFNMIREMCRVVTDKAKYAKATTTRAIETFAQAAPELAADGSLWDRDPWLLGTPAGTVDLKTGELLPASPEHFITRMAAVAPLPGHGAPHHWLEFLDDATRGDTDLIRYLQQIAGYALTGDTSFHALFFVYGPGGNGKSVFLNTMAGILGDYARTAAIDTFTAARHEAHPTGMAMLKGARLVTASETEDGRTWAEAKIKQMTGGDPITARFMNRDFFTYQPEFKLVIVGNHKPRLKNVDEATRRRFNIIPFTHKPQAPDKRLEEKLRAEWPAILRWMIEGCLDVQENGFVQPSVVTEATREYFEEQDVLGQWIEDCFDLDPDSRETNAQLFGSWKTFAEENGEAAGSMKRLAEMLRKVGFVPFKVGPSRGFRGLRFKSPEKLPRHGDW